MRTPRRLARLLVTLPFVCAASAMGAEVDLPRYPSVSPDGDTVAFSWRGDLWSVESTGGLATRLTSHPADETRSAWSPDGSMIAFETNREGVRALFVMSSTGADVRRVSRTDDSLTLNGWTADGTALLCSARIEGDVYRAERPYLVPIETGEPVRLHDAFGQAPSGSPKAGSAVYAFERGGSRTSRRHYRGPDDRDLFLYSGDNAGDTSPFTRLTTWEGNDVMPRMASGSRVVYLSDRADDTVNLWVRDWSKGVDARPKRLTNHTDRDVTHMDISHDGSTVAYTKWDGLHVARLRGDRLTGDTRITISAPSDASPLDELMSVASSVSEATLSPDGKTLAVVAMGDVYVRAIEDDAPTRRVTDTMARERGVVWSPDNTTLYFVSDEGGTESVHAATVLLTRDELKTEFTDATTPPVEEPEAVEDEEETTEEEDAAEDAEEGADAEDTDEDAPEPGERWADAMRFEVRELGVTGEIVRDLSPSPDGTRLAFRHTRGDMKILNLETGDVTMLYETWDFSTEMHWSPDGQWIAYAVDDADFNADIFIVPADGSADPINITRHPDLDYSPRWSTDGKMLAFLSTRQGDQADAHLVFLDADMEAMTSAERDAYFDEQAKAVKKLGAIDPPSDEDADEEADEDASEEEYEAPFTVEDLETAYLRLRRVTRYEGSEGSLAFAPDGSRVVVSANAGPEGSGLYTVKWDGSEPKRLSDNASVQGVSRDGQTLVLVRSGRARTVPIAGGSTETLNIAAEKRVDHGALSAQKFDELARELGTTFYHPDMKGLDWQALTDEYRALATRAHTPNEFGWVANRFLGELNASHLGVRPTGGFSDGDYRSAGRLGADVVRLAYHDAERTGHSHAYLVERVLPLATTRGGEMALAEGDLIVAVEFEHFGPDDTLDSMLAGRVGDETVLTVERDVDGAMKTLYLLRTPISSGAESRLRYNDWQRSRAALVDEWSGGRLGYLHIRSMGGADLIEFERDLFAAAEGKEGLLIDVRSNGGGWTTDRVLGSIMYTPHAYTIPRGAHPVEGQGYPRDRLFIQRYNLPINMLCNEKSFSNAEIISHAFKTLGRGTLVGEETYGGVISTGGFSLVDGTFVRRPFRGWFLPDGTDMENHGAMPDLRVEQTPEDEASGTDRQLETAVEDLLGRLD